MVYSLSSIIARLYHTVPCSLGFSVRRSKSNSAIPLKPSTASANTSRKEVMERCLNYSEETQCTQVIIIRRWSLSVLTQSIHLHIRSCLANTWIPNPWEIPGCFYSRRTLLRTASAFISWQRTWNKEQNSNRIHPSSLSSSCAAQIIYQNLTVSKNAAVLHLHR